MNRKHTINDYLKIYENLKKINSKIEFSSDFIIGYPGETNNDFNDTVNLIKKIKFINSFSFIFSPRPGTKAAEYDLIDNDISKERLKVIQQLLFSHQLDNNKLLNGTNGEVLIENKMKDQNKLFGRNKYLNSVIIENNENFVGKLVNVIIDSYNQNTYFDLLLYIVGNYYLY